LEKRELTRGVQLSAGKKRKGEGRWARGGLLGLAHWAGCPGLAQLGFPDFFCSFSFFYFSALVSLLFEVQGLFENKTFELVKFK
jgi:hypothetical protein